MIALKRLGGVLLHGATGVTAAMLLPKAISAAAQWLLVVSAGTAALTPYVTTTQRGSTAASLVSIALAPVVGRRRAALDRKSGRGLIGGALLLLGVTTFFLTFTFEATVGIGARRGLFSSTFAAMVVVAGPALVLWPILQTRDLYVRMVAFSGLPLVMCIALAALGLPQISAVLLATATAVPTVWLLGKFSLQRASRYSVGLVRRSVPLSAVTFFTAMVIPMALSRGETMLGQSVVGRQALFWSFIAPLGIASQAIAARLLVRDPDKALRAWLPLAFALSVVSIVIFVACRILVRGASDPATAMPASMAVLGASFIVSDPLCFFFCPPKDHRVMALGSFVCSAVVACALAAWPRMLPTVSVYGPVGIVFIGRMVFLRDRKLRATAYLLVLMLTLAFGAGMIFDISLSHAANVSHL